MRFGRIPKLEKVRILAALQSDMNNVVNEQLQNHFQLATISSSSSSPETLAPQTTSVCPPEPHATPSEQSPAHSSLSPPPSPETDTTINAIARAHSETFLYANDKLTNRHAPHQQQNDNHTHHRNKEAELWSNHCPGGFHSSLNAHMDPNLTNNRHNNGGRGLRNCNLIGGERALHPVTQRWSCPSGIVLVRSWHLIGRGF